MANGKKYNANVLKVEMSIGTIVGAIARSVAIDNCSKS